MGRTTLAMAVVGLTSALGCSPHAELREPAPPLPPPPSASFASVAPTAPAHPLPPPAVGAGDSDRAEQYMKKHLDSLTNILQRCGKEIAAYLDR